MVSSQTTSPAWDEGLLKNPHTVADKGGRVQQMFAAIAPSYDLNNRLHSLWMDQHWRRKAVKWAGLSQSDVVVDVACGTGDLTLAFRHEIKRIGDFESAGLKARGPRPRLSSDPQAKSSPPVIGIDFTYEMLPIARNKSASSAQSPIIYLNGDAQALPLPEACADVVSIAFGIRNVAGPATAIREFHRILRPGGRLIILEFSLPTNPLLRTLYNFYFRKILPRTATLISGDKTGAYKYLPESVNTFVGREQIMAMMSQAGFDQVEHRPMTFGVCICYRGVK